MKVEYISMHDLVIDKMNVRGLTTDLGAGDDDLCDSIKSQGIIEPLIVRQQGNKFGILCGTRRYYASSSIGLTELPCIQRNDLSDDLTAFGFSLQENLRRKNLTQWETAEAIKKGYDMQDTKLTDTVKRDKIQEKSGLSRDSINTYLNIANLPAKSKLPGSLDDTHILSATAPGAVTDTHILEALQVKTEGRNTNEG